MEKSLETTSEQFKKWTGLHEYVRSQVIGQDDAVSRVCGAVLAGEMGHTRPERPRSFMLLAGPTGVGKTKIAQKVSSHLFGTGQIARLNMAEYQEKSDLSRMLSYLRKQLERMQGTAGRFILFDEIEKAHRDISNVLLGMEEAKITIEGTDYDLSKFHIGVTTNLGASDAMELDENLPYEALYENQRQEALNFFKPEVFMRFSRMVVFRKLTLPAQLEICKQMVAEEIAHNTLLLGHSVSVQDGVYLHLANNGIDDALGARPLRNYIEETVHSALVNFRLGIARGELTGPIELYMGMKGFGIRYINSNSMKVAA